MTKFVKCKVCVSRLRIEVFDKKTGKPIIEEKSDWNGAPYIETQEVVYTRGEEISIPYDVMEKLGTSVEVVMAPVISEPVFDEPEEPAEGEFKDAKDAKTVADMFPPENPEEPKKTGKGTKAK